MTTKEKVYLCKKCGETRPTEFYESRGRSTCKECYKKKPYGSKSDTSISFTPIQNLDKTQLLEERIKKLEIENEKYLSESNEKDIIIRKLIDQKLTIENLTKIYEELKTSYISFVESFNEHILISDDRYKEHNSRLDRHRVLLNDLSKTPRFELPLE